MSLSPTPTRSIFRPTCTKCCSGPLEELKRSSNPLLLPEEKTGINERREKEGERRGERQGMKARDGRERGVVHKFYCMLLQKRRLR